jgi:hypothetical protein
VVAAPNPLHRLVEDALARPYVQGGTVVAATHHHVVDAPPSSSSQSQFSAVTSGFSAVKARSQATNQLKALLVTAPEDLRHRLRSIPTKELVATCARFHKVLRG